MRTFDFSTSIDIDRPADDVWHVVADYSHDHEWRRGVRSMETSMPGLVRPGVTTVERFRLAGRTYRVPGRVVEVIGTSLRWTADPKGPESARGTRSVTATGANACRVDLTMSLDVHGLESALSFLLEPMLRRNVEGDAARLRDLVRRRFTADRVLPVGPRR